MAEVTTRDDVLLAKMATLVAEKTAEAMVAAQAKFQAVENRNPPSTAWNETPGKERPTFRRETFFCGIPQNEKQCLDEEIDLFNQVEAGRYNGRKWEVVERGDGAGGDMVDVRIIGIQNKDVRMGLPGLIPILKQIIAEAKARK